MYFYLFLYRLLTLSGCHPVSSVVRDTTSSCILPLLTPLPLLPLLFLCPLHFSVFSYSSGSSLFNINAQAEKGSRKRTANRRKGLKAYETQPDAARVSALHRASDMEPCRRCDALQPLRSHLAIWVVALHRRCRRMPCGSTKYANKENKSQYNIINVFIGCCCC